jgi:SAM-dependent methyltransferase
VDSGAQRDLGSTEALAAVVDAHGFYRAQRVEHWDRIAAMLPRFDRANRGYHARLHEIYQSIIPPGQRVLEIGCGAGDLLASLAPAVGVGVDFSPKMIAAATARHPGLRFVAGDAHELALGEKFDFIVLSDLINDVWDIQRVLDVVRRHCGPSTRIVLNFYSRLWESPLRAVKALGLSRPNLEQNWVTLQDVANLMDLAECEIIRHSMEVLWPLRTPLVASVLNKLVVKIWPFSGAGLTHVVVARRRPEGSAVPAPRVTVVVPARNEAGNIPEIFDRVPDMGGGTELIFVEGHSTDATYEAIEREITRRSRPAVLLRQRGEGKGDAVREGFARASGDVLMILDADLTVAPEDLPRFFDALVSGQGDFINGVRLVYPMEENAMRFFNLLGNRFFGLLFSWLLGQPIRDTLCGTKVLWRRDYLRIARNRAFFGDFDPFGDFDLLFGAAKLTLKIVEVPIRYRQRRYGTTNIQRWRHGLLLFRMSFTAARKLKCV